MLQRLRPMVPTACWLLLASLAVAAEGPRRPVALVVSPDESTLWVANRDRGTISSLQLKSRQLGQESSVGKRLSDLVGLSDGRLLATDSQAGELLLLQPTDTGLQVAERLAISPDPHRLTVTADDRTAFVASKWSRRISEIHLPGGDRKSMQVARVIDFPFAPGSLTLVREDKILIVADHFRGRLGIVDAEAGKLQAVRNFYAHNIRGLGVDPRTQLLTVSHSMLNEYATTGRNDVHWGVLMSNDLRWLSLDQVIDPEADFYNHGHVHPLGEPGMGGSEPSGLALTQDGIVVVTMAGVDKIAFGKEGDFVLKTIKVGRGPTAAAVSDQHRQAYVANTYGDSISVIDLKEKRLVETISLGKTRPLTLAEQGESLFHLGRLSHDGWMTCHTCHPDGHTTGDLNDNFSDHSFGAAKRVPSLLGVSETAPYAWNGGTKTLAEQIRNSNQHTMQGIKANDGQVAALGAFLETLRPPTPIAALRGTSNDESIARGKAIFSARKCTSCHVPPTYTSAKTYDVGLHDKQGNTHFNPPSLRGVSQRGPYFHDSSAATLEEVFLKEGHQLNDDVLSDEELADLLAFLRSL